MYVLSSSPLARRHASLGFSGAGSSHQWPGQHLRLTPSIPGNERFIPVVVPVQIEQVESFYWQINFFMQLLPIPVTLLWENDKDTKNLFRWRLTKS